MGVGRVDFANLVFSWGTSNALTEAEVNLLNQYLVKDHRYRTKALKVPARFVGVASENIDPDTDADVYSNVVKVASATVGIDVSRLFENAFVFETSQPFLWGIANGFGNYNWFETYNASTGAWPAYRYTTELRQPANEPKGIFYIMQGSWFADFNVYYDNIARGLLATPNYGLAVIPFSTAAHVPVPLEFMAGDQPIGVLILKLINQLPLGDFRRFRWLCLLGDPTLRQVTQ